MQCPRRNMVEEPRDVGPRVELAPELVADRGPRVDLAPELSWPTPQMAKKGAMHCIQMHFNTFDALKCNAMPETKYGWRAERCWPPSWVGPRVSSRPWPPSWFGPRVELAHSTAQGKTIHINTFNVFLLHVVEPEIVAKKDDEVVDIFVGVVLWLSHSLHRLFSHACRAMLDHDMYARTIDEIQRRIENS